MTVTPTKTRVKIREAIRLIEEKERINRVNLTTEQRKKRTQEKEGRMTGTDQKRFCDYVSSFNTDTILTEIKAEKIWKVCSCGREFYVWSHHKGVRRNKCRICKPY